MQRKPSVWMAFFASWLFRALKFDWKTIKKLKNVE